MEQVKNISKEHQSVEGNVTNFLLKYRLLFLGIIGALIAVCVIFGVYTVISERSRSSDIAAVQEIIDTLGDAEESAYDSARAAAIEALSDYAAKNGIAGVRANMVTADLYFAEGKWQESRDAWLAAAQKGESDYTAPLCWYNAAVCCEELNDTEAAVSYFERAADTVGFGLASRALFNIGRIKDTAGDYEGAVEAYQRLNDTYPSDAWAALAMSRIIALRAAGKVL